MVTWLLQDQGVLRAFACRFIGKLLLEGGENIFLPGRPLGRVEQYLHAHPKGAFILPLVYLTKAPLDQVVVCIVPEFPGGELLEQTTARPKDVVRPGHNLLSMTDHAPRPSISGLREMAVK